MIRGFRQIASLTAVSRVLGMLRDMAFAHFFGAGWLMTAWTMGFKVPNLARRLFGEGAASASLIPVYSEELHHNPEQAKRLASTVVTVVTVILTAIVLVGEVLLLSYYGLFETRTGPRLGLLLCSTMLPYMIFICTSAILSGILNVHGHFAAPAAAPIVLNLFIIGGILLTGWATKMEPQRQVFFVAIAVLISGLAQVAIQIPSLRANGVFIRPAWDIRSEAFRKVIVLMGPMILGLAATQINTLADDIIALSFMNERGDPLSYGAPSHLYYAQRLYQFPLGVLGISLATAVFPIMSADAARKDFEAFTRTIARGIRAAVFVAIPATAGILLIAVPLVAAVFEHGQFKESDTPVVAWTLSFYAVGLCGYFLQQVTARAFYSLQDAKTPAFSAAAAVVANVILNLTLIWFLGTGGLAAATAICSYLQVVILVTALRRKLGRSILDGLAATLKKTLAATALMSVVGVGVLVLMRTLPDDKIFDVLRLGVVVPLAAATYLLAAKFLHIEMLSLLAGGKRR
ncbi:MAG: murein biosynthesis integral membrane protein MurJ [Planctomycetes bacterium RBG_16_55_9]|nr:MAG: murein biosynthesis integral membrane protein MurJ [Planctomycetes bacterium RBG_16_55_9]